ncbi:L-prolyl-[peptidyl carrier protein] dehydrogenase [Alteromonadaceae bacterium 2753L.S.0a.02]|nr:L-prolyl-[peptidyl carrier protein] dehydrogenase [Alteromonadaceae bacterium 2753L.S.0a.02]
MEFSWSESQTARFKHICEQVRLHIAPLVEARGIDNFFSRDEWRLCGDLGLLGLSVHESLGGQGLGWLDTARAMEAFGYACEDAGLPFSAAAHLFAVAMPIAEFASEDLARELLPGMCCGDLVGANAITEEQSGSDVFALQMSVEKDGDSYILNGNKNYISNAPIGDVFVTYGTINPKYGFLGVTAFVVDRNTPGLHISEPFYKTGLQSVPGGTARFENCRVPATRRLGEEGQGGTIFNRSMQWERACLPAIFLGVMERQLERAVTFAKQRRQFKTPLASFQAISHNIAEMKLRLEAARLLLYRGCWLSEQGENATSEISMAKLAVAECALHIGMEGTQVLGGPAIKGDGGMERVVRDALAASIASGTKNMQLELIAKGLGL